MVDHEATVHREAEKMVPARKVQLIFMIYVYVQEYSRARLLKAL